MIITDNPVVYYVSHDGGDFVTTSARSLAAAKRVATRTCPAAASVAEVAVESHGDFRIAAKRVRISGVWKPWEVYIIELNL